jgi:hypothetical protein
VCALRDKPMASSASRQLQQLDDGHRHFRALRGAGSW